MDDFAERALRNLNNDSCISFHGLELAPGVLAIFDSCSEVSVHLCYRPCDWCCSGDLVPTSSDVCSLFGYGMVTIFNSIPKSQVGIEQILIRAREALSPTNASNWHEVPKALPFCA